MILWGKEIKKPKKERYLKVRMARPDPRKKPKKKRSNITIVGQRSLYFPDRNILFWC
jgi:hypothetical protein